MAPPPTGERSRTRSRPDRCPCLIAMEHLLARVPFVLLRRRGPIASGLACRAAAAHCAVMARVAFIVGELFEDSELRVPYERVRAARHQAALIGLSHGMRLTGRRGDTVVVVEAAIADVVPGGFDALVIPGGHSPEQLRL